MSKLIEHILRNSSGVGDKKLPRGLNEAVATVVYVDLAAGDEVLPSMMFVVICKNVEGGMRDERRDLSFGGKGASEAG
ncbi:MAG: hypothetical protein ACO3O8_04685 [Pelagibacteraceae bacterium]